MNLKLAAIIFLSAMWMLSNQGLAEPNKETNKQNHLASSAKTVLEQAIKEARAVIAQSQDKDKRRIGLEKIVNRLIDFDELSQRTLAQSWADLSTAQKKQIKKLLADLIQVSYLGQLNEASRFELNMTQETPISLDEPHLSTLGSAPVIAAVRVDALTQADKADVNIQFYLRQKNVTDTRAQWILDDVVINDVSVVRNYRSQFAKIMQQSGFDLLAQKLKKKIEEIRAQ